MTRLRCPKCQKYYVTQTFEQRPLPTRTADAIMRSLRRDPAPVAPYRRYVCDICGHRWAVLVAAVASTPGLRAAGASAWRGRTISTGTPSFASVPSRAGATYPGGRSGTLMDAHPGASQRLRRREPGDTATTEYPSLAQGAAPFAWMATAPTFAAADLAEVPVPLDMESWDEAPTSPWRELWRFILPS